MGERKKILPQMFDVRPVDRAGNLDLEKINRVEKATHFNSKKIVKSKEPLLSEKKSAPNSQPKTLHRTEKSILTPQKNGSTNLAIRNIPRRNSIKKPDNFLNTPPRFKNEYFSSLPAREKKYPPLKNDRDLNGFYDQTSESKLKKKLPRNRQPILKHESGKLKVLSSGLTKQHTQGDWRRWFFLSVKIIATLLVIFLILNGVWTTYHLKSDGYAQGQTAISDIGAAKNYLEARNFTAASGEFQKANIQFAALSNEIGMEGAILADSTKYMPYLSKVSSDVHLIAAGKDLSQSGILASNILAQLNTLRAQIAAGKNISYLKVFQDNEAKLETIDGLLKDANSNLASVNADDLPAKYQDQFTQMDQYTSKAATALDSFLAQKSIINDILGGNGPRKYLFLFENNQEMRPTGGFIGTYGELDIFNGRVEKFFMDGIYDPDGQLKDRIVPPAPIQKISANWSMHDSNWWPDFPTSAKKVAWFYEQDGGPTVDGVIAITPTVLQDLLAITGPIPMPNYGVTVDQNNFMPLIQYKVEVDYNKTLNRPKQILSDLAPKIINKILNDGKLSDVVKMANIILENLNEKQIQIYSRNPQVENLMDQNNWSGRILSTQKDYVSVINTNINGFKTDGVVAQSISQEAQIQPDGSVIDTLTIVRHHNGGNTPYDWYNQVNDDYMRVYVPQGSQLLSASGQTREIDKPPLDYDALGYQRDPEVEAEEKATKIDPASGTRIYTEDGKTVFANWVYVSPQETVTVKYTYLLPFKVEPNEKTSLLTYSLLAQKEAGDPGSKFESAIVYPSGWNIVWQDPGDGLEPLSGLPNGQKGIKMETDLKTDKFIGLAFTK